MALPKPATIARGLQPKREKLALEANDGQAIPANPVDLNFVIPQFTGMVLLDFGAGANRIILMGGNELGLPYGLTRSDVWIEGCSWRVLPYRSTSPSVVVSIQPGYTVACLIKLLLYTDICMDQLRQLVPLAGPCTILIDFGKAASMHFEMPVRILV